jgi:hypothetical protein
MEPIAENKEDGDDNEKKSSDDKDDEKDEKADTTLVLTEAEKRDAGDRFDLLDIDYDGLIDFQLTKKLLEGTELRRAHL